MVPLIFFKLNQHISKVLNHKRKVMRAKLLVQGTQRECDNFCQWGAEDDDRKYI